jgi:hypothetical protein
MKNDLNETSNLLHGDVDSEVEVTRLAMRNKLLEYEREWGLQGYVGEDDFKIGEPYQPHPQRNEAFPRFPLKLTSETEKAEMNDLLSEIPLAIAKEPIVNLRDLDISSWQHNLNVSDKDLEDMLAAHDQLRTESTQYASN